MVPQRSFSGLEPGMASPPAEQSRRRAAAAREQHRAQTSTLMHERQRVSAKGVKNPPVREEEAIEKASTASRTQRAAGERGGGKATETAGQARRRSLRCGDWANFRAHS